MKKKKPEVRTEQYEFAHGHKPKGTGIWAFATYGVNVKVEDMWFAFVEVEGTERQKMRNSNLTYVQAKKAAREHFVGHPQIFVLS